MIERVIEARTRDLGGFSVGRVLPAVGRRTVGPFIFLDHMGPAAHEQVTVRPHPHLHLATVTYLFEGAVVHRDSVGSHVEITPGAINWMHAGRGIVHSERSDTPATMHGLQLWVALPSAHEDSDPAFDHYPAAALPAVSVGGAAVRVLAGEAYGARSPVRTRSPLHYVDAVLEPGAELPLTDDRERAVYVIEGAVAIDGQRVEGRRMAVLAAGGTPVVAAETRARVVLLGGEPLDGPRYIWWNFVSSSKAAIDDAAARWRAGGFPKVPGDEVEYIPAPEGPRFAEGA